MRSSLEHCETKLQKQNGNVIMSLPVLSVLQELTDEKTKTNRSAPCCVPDLEPDGMKSFSECPYGEERRRDLQAKLSK